MINGKGLCGFPPRRPLLLKTFHSFHPAFRRMHQYSPRLFSSRVREARYWPSRPSYFLPLMRYYNSNPSVFVRSTARKIRKNSAHVPGCAAGSQPNPAATAESTARYGTANTNNRSV